MSEVKLISESFVRPKEEVKGSERKYDLGPGGLRRLALGYMQHGFLYKTPPSRPTSTMLAWLEELKRSLAVALVEFYPTAGQFERESYEKEQACCVFIDCHKGPGVKVIHATALGIKVCQVMALNADLPKVINSFFDLGDKAINYDGHRRPLFSVQVTELADGVFMGLSMNHSVADGTGFLHFMNVWSNLHMGRSRGTPVYYKHTLREKTQNGPKIIKLPYLKTGELIASRNDDDQVGLVRERVFNFSSTSLAMLKAKVNAEANKHSVNTNNIIDISSFQALSALVWRCITRAQNTPFDHDTTFAFPVDLRPRFNPPLSPLCFGNFIKRACVIVKVGDLLSNGLGWIAKHIQQVLLAQDHKVAQQMFLQPYVTGSVDMISNSMSSASGSYSVWMDGAAKFDVFGIEFGFGKPVALRSGYANKEDGTLRAFAASSRDGSLGLEVCLAPHTMTALLSDLEFMSYVSVFQLPSHL